jgi:hypothetical protein
VAKPLEMAGAAQHALAAQDRHYEKLLIFHYFCDSKVTFMSLKSSSE